MYAPYTYTKGERWQGKIGIVGWFTVADADNAPAVLYWYKYSEGTLHTEVHTLSTIRTYYGERCATFRLRKALTERQRLQTRVRYWQRRVIKARENLDTFLLYGSEPDRTYAGYRDNNADYADSVSRSLAWELKWAAGRLSHWQEQLDTLQG